MRKALWIMVTNLLTVELFSFSLSFMSVVTMRCILTPVMNVAACVAERLKPRTLDLEVRDTSLRRRVVFFDEELFSTLSLFTQVYKWVPGTVGRGGGGVVRNVPLFQTRC